MNHCVIIIKDKRELIFILFGEIIDYLVFYYLIYYSFKDVNECNIGSCDENANCTNYPGSYSCACIPGFYGNGHNCTGMYLLIFSYNIIQVI